MQKITRIEQIYYNLALPKEVIKVISDSLSILEAEYGQDLDTNNGYGGFVVVLQSEQDLPSLGHLLAEHYIDHENLLPEFVDVIICSNGQIFTYSLILCGSDFSIVIISPLTLTPESLKRHIGKK